MLQRQAHNTSTVIMSFNNTQQTCGTQQISSTQTISIQNGPAVIRLRASEQASSSNDNNVRWQTDVIDNENMNKKKTKICCIYHPQDEDEDEGVQCTSDHEHPGDESSSSSSESDNDKDLDFEERRRRRVERRHRKLTTNTKSDPNAYEVQPDYIKHREKREQQLKQHEY